MSNHYTFIVLLLFISSIPMPIAEVTVDKICESSLPKSTVKFGCDAKVIEANGAKSDPSRTCLTVFLLKTTISNPVLSSEVWTWFMDPFFSSHYRSQILLSTNLGLQQISMLKAFQTNLLHIYALYDRNQI